VVVVRRRLHGALLLLLLHPLLQPPPPPPPPILRATARYDEDDSAISANRQPSLFFSPARLDFGFFWGRGANFEFYPASTAALFWWELQR
jgi:hypothetical protein